MATVTKKASLNEWHIMPKGDAYKIVDGYLHNAPVDRRGNIEYEAACDVSYFSFSDIEEKDFYRMIKKAFGWEHKKDYVLC